jgi:hypothetical protein
MSYAVVVYRLLTQVEKNQNEFLLFQLRFFHIFYSSYKLHSVLDFTQLSASDLDDLVRRHMEGNDDIGANAMRAKLFRQGIKVYV